MEKILVTGGAGYIGSHVVEILLQNNKQVRVLDNGMFGFGALYPFYENTRFELVRGDLRNISDLKKSLKGVEGVIHLGGIVGNPACSFDKLTCQDVNVTATERLASASAEAGIRHQQVCICIKLQCLRLRGCAIYRRICTQPSGLLRRK